MVTLLSTLTGVAIAGTITITAHPVTEVPGKLVDLKTECGVEVRGTSMRSFAAVPAATGTRWALGSGIAVFALRLLSFRGLGLRLLSFRHFGFWVSGFFCEDSSSLPFCPFALYSFFFSLFFLPPSAERIFFHKSLSRC
ncbi:hypothetical protein MiSe_01980 [Microseira wollei NIES-4236]|uniref:Secreted protein n=1 Tax=Microseira wollei NIES-4236 TaxID=2530354 RepID=A0AAV3X4E9_9CYAN|nr:hypothetical protein MiSe_01980 [Microseira wollei NIES-4236]